MKKMITLAALLLCTSLQAEDPTGWLDQQRETLTRSVAKADAEMIKTRIAASRLRTSKVRRYLQGYLKALTKVRSYWTKKGDFEKAISVNKEITSVKKILNGKKLPNPKLLVVKKKAKKAKKVEKPKPRGRVIIRRIYLPGGGPNDLRSDSEIGR